MQQTKSTLITHPFDAVVFGGRGDLAKRKLLPALYHLDLENRLPPDGRIIAASRGATSAEDYRALVHDACLTYLPKGQFDEVAWARFSARLDYVALDAADGAGYRLLNQAFSGREDVVRCFYLATAPELFVPIANNLAAAKLITPVTRLVLEKPLGKDLVSAHAINAAIGQSFSEHQIYRIDHYLGKETVQNLMVLRFGNTIFEPLWSREHVDHVQITVAEDIGVEGRGKFYEAVGITRDIVQNHALQILSLEVLDDDLSAVARSILELDLRPEVFPHPVFEVPDPGRLRNDDLHRFGPLRG